MNFSANVKSSTTECVSNQSLRMKVRVDETIPVLVKIGLQEDNFESMAMSMLGDPSELTIKIGFNDDTTSTVLETWNCGRAQPCQRQLSWEEWEKQEMRRKKDKDHFEPFQVTTYKVLTALLARELELTSACSELGSDAIASR